jgi:uncharacterized protein
MPRPSVVLDTNVVVSAHLSSNGLERFVLDLAINQKLALYYSESILAEYESVLSRARFKIAPARLAESLGLIRNAGKRVAPRRRLQIALDPSDDIFLECAEQARVQYLVTGNKRHFPAVWKSTRIVNARELIEEVIPNLKR